MQPLSKGAPSTCKCVQSNMPLGILCPLNEIKDIVYVKIEFRFGILEVKNIWKEPSPMILRHLVTKLWQNPISAAAILDFAIVATPVSAGFGALKNPVQYVLVYICAKVHACRLMCTIPPQLLPKLLHYRFEVLAFWFSPRRPSWLSCINEFLAIDRGGNVS